MALASTKMSELLDFEAMSGWADGDADSAYPGLPESLGGGPLGGSGGKKRKKKFDLEKLLDKPVVLQLPSKKGKRGAVASALVPKLDGGAGSDLRLAVSGEQGRSAKVATPSQTTELQYEPWQKGAWRRTSCARRRQRAR